MPRIPNEHVRNELPNRDIIMRYTFREMRTYVIRWFGHMKPDVLRQLIHQSTSLPVNRFRQLVEALLSVYCHEFTVHSTRWRYTTADPDILTRMVQYHTAWEGFASDEPWYDSSHRRISYFFDDNYEDRLREMEAQFYA